MASTRLKQSASLASTRWILASEASSSAQNSSGDAWYNRCKLFIVFDFPEMQSELRIGLWMRQANRGRSSATTFDNNSGVVHREMSRRASIHWIENGDPGRR
jgi:hypothetical protein